MVLSLFLISYAQFLHSPSTTLVVIIIGLPFSLVMFSVPNLLLPLFKYLFYTIITVTAFLWFSFQTAAEYPPLAVIILLAFFALCNQQYEFPAASAIQSMKGIHKSHGFGTVIISILLF